MNCKVCSRNSVKNDLCQFHSRARDNIVEAYEDWRKGLRTSWEDYLRRIRDNRLTGQWALEVAEYLIEKEGKENVKKS